MKKTILLSIVFFFILSLSFAITGKAILDQVKSAHSDFNTEKSIITMKLMSSNGSIRERKFTMYIMHKKEKTFTLVRFTAPSEVRRITLLTLSDNEIYLYMPAYRRTKRISGGAKNGKFAGSDFSYNDISLLYNEKTGDYDAKLLSSDGAQYVVEILPHDPNSDYKKIIVTIDKKTLLFKQVDFFDSSDEKVKIMYFSDVKNFDGHILATKITLKNVKESHETILNIDNVDFNIPITSKFFNRRNISKPILRYQ